MYMYLVPREALDLQDEDKYVMSYTDKNVLKKLAVNIITS